MHEPPSAFFADIGGLGQHIDSTPSDVVRMSQFDPNVDELKKGLMFLTKKQLKDVVASYSIVQSREYKASKNSNKKNWEVVCKHCDTTNCQWYLRASIQQKHGMFEIVTYKGPHTCFFEKSDDDHPQLNTNIIANEILSLVRADLSMKIKVIVEAVKNAYKKYRISYYKAWFGKQKVISIIFGDWDESYRRLPKFLGAIQKYNPGTIVKWSTLPSINPDETTNPDKVIFHHVFWAFKASIDGFKNYRPVISIDATFLYGKYKGKILIAVSKDGNNQLFPIAFAIVDEESANNWGWFLYNLRHNVVGDRADICLISDRHKGIIKVVNDVKYGWTDHHHKYCLRHVCSNFNSKFQNSILKDLVWEADSTTQIRVFDKAMEKIKDINQNAWEYLSNIPAKRLALCHDGGYRFGETTTNMVESYNGVLKEGRKEPANNSLC